MRVQNGRVLVEDIDLSAAGAETPSGQLQSASRDLLLVPNVQAVYPLSDVSDRALMRQTRDDHQIVREMSSFSLLECNLKQGAWS